MTAAKAGRERRQKQLYSLVAFYYLKNISQKLPVTSPYILLARTGLNKLIHSLDLNALPPAQNRDSIGKEEELMALREAITLSSITV